MDKHRLTQQSGDLLLKIDDLLWDAARLADQQRYARLTQLYAKAMRRHERRFNALCSLPPQ